MGLGSVYALGLTRRAGKGGGRRRWGGVLFFAAGTLAGLDSGVRLPGDGIALRPEGTRARAHPRTCRLPIVIEHMISMSRGRRNVSSGALRPSAS